MQGPAALEPTHAGEPEDPWRVDRLERIGVARQLRGLAPLSVDRVLGVGNQISRTATDPVSYVQQLFDRHQVVFVGVGLPSRRTGGYLAELVEAVADVGVEVVATEFVCADDQWLLDALVEADGFDHEPAAGPLVRWPLRHGYGHRELLSMVEAAWRTRQAGKPMRVVGLEYDLCFDAVTDTADLLSPYPWPHLRHRGSAGRHMREVLEAEVLAGGAKALVVTRTQHALARLRRRPHALWDAYDAEITDGTVVGAANHVYSTLADRAATVLLHQPLPASGPWGDWTLPADGWLDAALATLGGPPVPCAFDVTAGELAALECTSGLDGGVLSDWATGWVYLEDGYQREPPTPPMGVVGASNLKLAKRCSLDGWLRRPDATPNDFNSFFATWASAAELAWTQVL